MANAKAHKNTKLDHRGKERFDEIVRSRKVAKSFVVPVELCELPDGNLRTRFNTLDLPHVQRIKNSFIKDRVSTSEWTLAVFGVAPSSFKMESYLGRSAVPSLHFHLIIYSHLSLFRGRIVWQLSAS